ncbi:MAG: AI-2E family transporter [Candidatus Moranbacteria bacterium]|nr:AI-2E family transporter [Candidatus Moranbacteria bacterium]
MDSDKYGVYFFFFVLFAVSAVTYFILKPFFFSIILAGMLAGALQRPYNFLVKATGGRKGLSSLLISLLGMILFLTLMGAVIGIVAKETAFLYQSTISEGSVYEKYAEPFMSHINQNQFLRSLGFENMINGDILGKSFSQIGQGFFMIVQKIYQGIADTTFSSVVIFFTLYFLLIEGKKLVRHIIYLIPLKNSHKKVLSEKFVSITRATAKGAMIIAIIQGSLGMLLFLFLGIDSAFILGIFMMLSSLIPMFGAGLVWFPTAIVMFLTGNIWQGWIILAVGGGVISTIDNFLRPKLVGKDTQMHPLIVFFATLGGITVFGFLGLLIGPIIVALFLSLWDIYAEEFKGQLKKYNK